VTKGGKLFATVYILVAGTILLNNMSMISMIPLELRKRRIEHSVLTQVSACHLISFLRPGVLSQSGTYWLTPPTFSFSFI
jgi:hypothetical protein